MMLIAFGIVLLLLPIFGYMGAFKAIKTEYTEAVEVQLPPPPPVSKVAEHKKAHAHAAHHGEVHEASSTKPLPIHVAAAAPAPGASADDNAIVNGSNTNIGRIPVASTATRAPSVAPPPVAAPPAPAPVAQVATPAHQPIAPAIAPVSDVAASVIPSTQVKPIIPDDLRDSDLDAKFRALFVVHADGTADVKVVDSTGNNELDQLALQAAREWRFHPAIEAGRPVESYLRLEVEFQVS
jgi:protein TonB